IANVNCRVDGGTWTSLCAGVVLGEGVHSVEFYATNGAGLVESTQSITIMIDVTPPATIDTLTGELGDNGWYRSNVTVSFNSTDWAGNPEPEHTKAIDIDTTDPMASASVPSPSGHDGWYLSALSVQLEASDATSGVTGLFYQVDGGGWQHYTVPFMIGTGQHLVRFYSTDLAGRSSPVGSLSLNVDPTAPTTRWTFAATMGSNGWYVSDVVVTLSAFDGVSGIATVEYRVNDGPWLSY